jgi:hypothetical protein
MGAVADQDMEMREMSVKRMTTTARRPRSVRVVVRVPVLGIGVGVGFGVEVGPEVICWPPLRGPM